MRMILQIAVIGAVGGLMLGIVAAQASDALRDPQNIGHPHLQLAWRRRRRILHFDITSRALSRGGFRRPCAGT